MARAYTRYQTGGQGRVPPEHQGIQVNACRNVACSNFGVSPLPHVNKGRSPKLTDNYRVAGVKNDRARKQATIQCKVCGQTFTLKSNVAIHSELQRQQASFHEFLPVCCRSPGCSNARLSPDTHPAFFQAFGRTEAGSRRYRCKGCGKTFSVSQSPSLRHRLPDKTELVARLLINKMPMRRICEAADVRPAVLYNRIDYLHRQTQRLSTHYERQLLRGMSLPFLRIAVDRQDHIFNWNSGADRRNTRLTAVGSADCGSGYVFRFHLDYDPDLNPFDVDLHAREIGDYDLAPPFRHYAHLYLPGDYTAPAEPGDDIERLAPGSRLPTMGMRVHSDYVLFAHFHYLKWLLPGAEHIHFYLDQEPNIRGACLNAFTEKVKGREVEAFFVSIDKDLTVDEKKLELAHSETMFARLKEQYPQLKKREIALEVMRQRYRDACARYPNPLHRWIENVLPNMGEPKKQVCSLTARPEDDALLVATGLLGASLHPIDRFFMQIRRRVSLLERPIATASSTGRTWYGYSGYNPGIAQKIMESFRVIYNYCLVGSDHKTPAMRLGLINEQVSLGQLLKFIEPTPR